MVRVIMHERDIQRSLDRMSLEIIERHHGTDNIVIVGIHTGGVFLAQRLQAMIQAHEEVSLPVCTLDITLYRDDWSLIAQNPIVKKTTIDFDLNDKHVVLVDDVIFTGRTIRAAMDALMDYGRPQTIELAALIDRGERELPIQPDYVGMPITVGQGERVDVLLTENDARDQVIISHHNEA